MKRYKLFVVLGMLVVGLTLVVRSCHPHRTLPPDVAPAAIGYRLNDSIRNACSESVSYTHLTLPTNSA